MAGKTRRTSRNIRSPSGAYVVVDTAGKEHLRKTGPSKKAKSEPVVAPADICSVVYCDNDIVAANKSPGYPVVPTGQYHRRSVLLALAELGFSGLFPVNLLDREASGLVLFSRTEAAAKALRWNWRSNACERQFIAVVEGGITGARGRITLPIGVPRGKGKGHRRQVLPVDQGGRSATTKWKLLARGRGKSRLLITLHSGRCHQIRIHLAAIGHPVINERVYLPRDTDMPLKALVGMPDVQKQDVRNLPAYQIGLHSLRIQLPHPSTNAPLDFKAPVPRSLLDLMPGAWVVDAA